MIKLILRLIFLIILAGVFLTIGKVLQEKKANNLNKTEKIKSESVVYFEEVSGYIAKPSGEGPFPALILIHEWWGLNDDIKSLADKFAQEGYIALAVDMYKGKSTEDPAIARELASAVRADVSSAFIHLRGAMDYLKTLPEVDSAKIASVGWCFGGGWSYQMAVNDLGTRASVMYYGQFDPEDDFSHMKADILGHFGETDTGIKIDNVKEFQAKLNTTNGSHEVYIYPNVGHGFANARGGTNMAYSEEQANLAWDRTLEFLKQVFNE